MVFCLLLIGFISDSIQKNSGISHHPRSHLSASLQVIFPPSPSYGMTNLDSILKSRDITLPTKVCIIKIMVFPVVMYGCESWTIKKAEH